MDKETILVVDDEENIIELARFGSTCGQGLEP
jgi:hypothetical protein